MSLKQGVKAAAEGPTVSNNALEILYLKPVPVNNWPMLLLDEDHTW